MKAIFDAILGRIRQKDEVTPEDTVPAENVFYTQAQVQDLLAVSERTSSFLRILQLFGSTVKALPVDASINGITAATSALTSRAINRVCFCIEKEVTITGVNFVMQTAFAGTGDQYNGFGLYSLDLTTGLSTKIAETNNDINLFKAAPFTIAAKAFPAPVVLQPGFYYIDLLYCSSVQTTAPVMYTWGALSANQGLYLPSPHKFTGVVTGQTALPATVNNSAFSASAPIFSVSLY